MEALPLLLPSNYAWLLPYTGDVQKLDDLVKAGRFPGVHELYVALAYALMFNVLRRVLTRILFRPLAEFSMGDAIITIKNEKVKDKKIIKFVEAAWRLCFYAAFCGLGFFVLFLNPTTVNWISDTKNHWTQWLAYSANIDYYTKLYYQLQIGVYLHQLWWTEINRKDYKEMIIHHIATLLLLSLSYVTSFTRIGTTIILVHDLADIFLETAKIFVYLKKYSTGAANKINAILADGLFAMFAVVFFVTRLIYYPRNLLYSLLVEAPLEFGYWPGYYCYAVLLSVLQVLHVFWFSIIAYMIFKIIKDGGIQKDERSDDESDGEKESSDRPIATKKTSKPNSAADAAKMQ